MFTPQIPIVSDLLVAVKLALRVNGTTFDSEIEGVIAASKSDLKMSGVKAAAVDAASPDALIVRAVVCYAKAEFGLDNQDSEKYMASYRSLETHLALSSEYQEPPVVTP